jgi:DNA invertase Pin-like site-specific DNA recombinase
MDDTDQRVIQLTGVTPLDFARQRGDRRSDVPRRLPPKPPAGGPAVQRRHPLRAILLARVSTKHAEQDTSPDRQLARLEAIAKERGWVVVDKIAEKASGRQILDRPPVARALQRIVDFEADVLAVDHLSRLGRNAREALEVIDILHHPGVNAELYEATYKLDTTNPLGRHIFTAFASLLELETADRRRKIIEGLDHARSKGKKLGKPSTIGAAAKARAFQMRLEEKPNGDPPSWNEIKDRLADEGFGKFNRGAISRAVTRMRTAEPIDVVDDEDPR